MPGACTALASPAASCKNDSWTSYPFRRKTQGKGKRGKGSGKTDTVEYYPPTMGRTTWFGENHGICVEQDLRQHS